MRWVRFSLAVLGTSLVLVGIMGVIGVNLAGNALAAAATSGHGDWTGQVPPELSSLKDIPQAERFAHFKGVQVNLTDKDGKPVTLAVTPGVATNVSSNSVTLNGNDGAAHTYTIDSSTITRGKPLASGEDVVVLTLNGASDARAVFGLDPSQMGHGGPPWTR